MVKNKQKTNNVIRLDEPMPLSALPAEFFNRDTVTVARDLLGCRLICQMPVNVEAAEIQNQSGSTPEGLLATGTVPIPFIIVETEAYTADDPACHAYQKPQGRAAMLYQSPGTAYVYIIYGMHHCLNVVTEPEGTAGAVLFRALQPPLDSSFLTHGPGRLCKALSLTRDDFNGMSLTDATQRLFLSPGASVKDADVIQATRIGITKAVDYPWRFYVKGNPWVSVRDKARENEP